MCGDKGKTVLDSRMRKYIQKAMDGIAKYSGLIYLHPNVITTIAFILGLGCAFAISRGFSIIAFCLLWVSGTLDVLDGTVARLTGKSSQFGAYLDMIFDRMVEAAIIVGFFFLAPEHALTYLFFFVAVLFNFTTFMLAGNLFKNTGVKSMHYDFGLAERTETFIFFSLLILFPSYIVIILNVFNAIVFLTGIVRIIRIAKALREDTSAIS